MEVVFILLPLALLIAGVMLALFVWAVRSGQFDDLETPAVRILFEDQPRPRRPRPHHAKEPSPRQAEAPAPDPQQEDPSPESEDQ